MYPVDPAQLFITISLENSYGQADPYFAHLKQVLTVLPFRCIQLTGWSHDKLSSQLKKLRHILLSQPARVHLDFGSLHQSDVEKIYQFTCAVFAFDANLARPIITCEWYGIDELKMNGQFLALTQINSDPDVLLKLSQAYLQENIALIVLSSMAPEKQFLADYFWLTQIMQLYASHDAGSSSIRLNRVLLCLQHYGLQLLQSGVNRQEYLGMALTDLATLSAAGCYPKFIKHGRELCAIFAALNGDIALSDELIKTYLQGDVERVFVLRQTIAQLSQSADSKNEYIKGRVSKLPWVGQFKPTALDSDYDKSMVVQQSTTARSRFF